MRPGPVLAAVAIFGLLLLSSGGAKASGLIPPEFDDQWPDDELDELVCAAVEGQKGATNEQLAATIAAGLAPGFTWPGVLPGQMDFLARILAKVEAAISGELVCDVPVSPDNYPTPGGIYQIAQGDVMLGANGIVARAYPGLSSGARPERVKLISNHPRNLGVRIKTTNAGNANLIGPETASMFPKWRCSPAFERERFESGTCYATVFIPEVG